MCAALTGDVKFGGTVGDMAGALPVLSELHVYVETLPSGVRSEILSFM